MKFKNVLAFVLFFFSVLHGANATVKDNLEPAKLNGKLKEEFAKLDIKGKLKLLDLDILDGIKASAEYVLKVEPSYVDGFYSRIDEWEVETKISAGDLLGHIGAPIYFNIKKDAKITFVRQMKKQSQALGAKPLTPDKLPLTAKKALDLIPGTFAALPTKLNLVVGAGTNFGAGVFEGRAGLSYLISGEFIIHFFRLDDNKVRLKLIAVHKQGSGVGSKFGADFEVFGIHVVDKAIKRVVNTNLFDIGLANRSNGNLFIIDYLLDLNSPEVQEIYNELLNSSLKFKSARQLKKFLTDKSESEALVTSLEDIEGFYEKEKKKDPLQRLVDRKFKGTNVFRAKSKNFKFGLNVLRYGYKKQYTQNLLSYFTEDGTQEYMAYDVFSRRRSSKFFFGIRKEEKEHNNFMLLKANPDGSILEGGLSDYGYTAEFKDNDFDNSEQLKLKELILQSLPDDVYRQIDWDKIITKADQHNAKVYFQFLFDRKILDMLRKKRESSVLNVLFDNYRENMDNIGVDVEITSNRQDKIVETLSNSLNNDLTNYNRRQKVENYLGLAKYKAFRRYGMGFLTSLLSPSQISENMYFKMIWSSQEKDVYTFEYGHSPVTELFQTVQFVQSVINNRSFDLRLVGYDPEKAAELNSK